MSRRVRSSIGLIVAVCGFAGSARAQEFEVPATYALPQTPVVWTAGNFDGDAYDDIAIVTNDGAVVTAFNHGQGTFAETASSSGVPIGQISVGAQAARAGDFNGDGLDDLLVTSSRVGSADADQCVATLFLNLGDGTFGAGTRFYDTPETAYDYLSGCTGLELVDFNLDGRLDFVLGYASFVVDGGLDGHVGVFSGRGDGTFDTPRTIDLSDRNGPEISLAMVVGDFDGDDLPDLGFGEDTVYLSGPQRSRAAVLSGDGTGDFYPTFTSSAITPFFGTFTAARAFDVTDDFRPDLFLLEGIGLSDAATPQDLPVLQLLYAGNRTLSAPTAPVRDFGGVSFENADFNGDRLPDLLLVSDEDRLKLAHGDGQGGYTTTDVLTAGGGAIASLTDDFNRDGHSDLGVLDADGRAFRIALGQAAPDGLPLPRVTTLPSPGDLVRLGLGDFDGDGKVDVFASEYGAFDVLLGTGDGYFAPGAHIVNNGFPLTPLVADVNADGLLDVVVPAADANFQTLFGSADATFSGVTSVDLGDFNEFSASALGDYDGDGDLDLAAFRTTTSGSPPVSELAIRFYRNDGAGHFSFDQEIPLANAVSTLAFADLNGDSELDLFAGAASISGNTSASLSLLGDGTGNFTQRTAIAAAAPEFELGDFNGDGRLDLVTNTSLALGQGDGTFGALVPFDAASFWVAIGDVNADGALDLVTLEGRSVDLALGHGDGTFEPVTALMGTSPNNPVLSVLELADLGGDHAPSIITARVPNLADDTGRVPEVVTIVNRELAPPPPPPPPPPRCAPPHYRPPFPHGRPHRRDWFGWGRLDRF